MKTRKCLKCQKDFVHELPPAYKRICPVCEKTQPKSYGNIPGGNRRRSGRGINPE